MTDKFYVWFWKRREPIDKVLIVIIPVDILFVSSLLLFTSIPGPGIAILTLILTMVTLGIFKLVEFIFNEHKAFQEAKDKEAELIVGRLKGDEPKTGMR